MPSIIAADIGGTNARFALFSLRQGELTAEKTAWLSSQALHTTDDLWQAAEQALGLAPAAADVVSIALAGPVAKGRGKLTQGPLEVDCHDGRHGKARVLVMNDFLAQAHACLGPVGQAARCVVAPTAVSETDAESSTAGRAVLGAGTGLGAALMACSHGQWLALPAEFGHVAFPFTGAEEQAFQKYLCQRLHQSYALNEDVLSGRGLEYLHHFLTGQELPASQIGPLALQAAEGEESPTLCWFARFYARLCRNWIVSTLCRGGLWLAGGIAAKNPRCVQCAAFFQELYCMPDYEMLVRSVPLYLVDDANSGLWGAAGAAAALLEAH